MNLRTITALALLLVTPATAAEFDFAVQLVDLDKNPIRNECVKVSRKDPANPVCEEWSYRTLGLLAAVGLDAPEVCPQTKLPVDCMIAQSRRATLARKVHPGKEEKHLVEVSSADITLIIESVGRLNVQQGQIRAIESLQVIEILDPARLK